MHDAAQVYQFDVYYLMEVEHRYHLQRLVLLEMFNLWIDVMTEPAFMTIAELGPLLQQRQISPVEVVESLLRRVSDLNPLLNAYLTVCADAALSAARDAAEKPGRGPLYGIPVAHKDVFWTRGVHTTAHSRILEHFVPEQDATCVARLRDHGTILLGKLNTHEMAVGSMEWRGFARNPWNTACVPGGSSSGSGVALAAGLITAATGSDTGGSTRLPASLCGVAGLKPTFGRVSRHGLIPVSPSMDCPGPMARSVEDLAILLQAMAGPDPSDPSTSGHRVPDFRAKLKAGVRGLVLGLPRQHFFSDLHPETRDCVQTAIHLLEAEGARLEEISLPSAHPAALFAYRILAGKATYAFHRQWLSERPTEYGVYARRRIITCAFFTAGDVEVSQRVWRRLKTEFAAAFSRVDAIVTPTTPFPAFPAGQFSRHFENLAAMTRPISVAGLPAVSIPCGFTAGGLPIGLQITGRPWDEVRVLQAAAAYEASTNWRRRQPTPMPLPPVREETPRPALLPADAPDPSWIRGYAAVHDIPLLAEDAEAVARLLGEVLVQVREFAGPFRRTPRRAAGS